MLSVTADRLGLGKRRHGLAPLEFLIALPFLCLLLLCVMQMNEACTKKAFVNIQVRQEAWDLRHAVSSDVEYDHPTYDDTFLGEAGQTINKIDDQVRWFQLGKIHFIEDSISVPKLYMAHKGVREREVLQTHKLPPALGGSTLNVRSRHYVLGGTWDYNHIPLGTRLPLLPHLRCVVFVIPSFEQQGYLKYANMLTTVVGRLGELDGLFGNLRDLAGGVGFSPPATPSPSQIINDSGFNDSMSETNEQIDFFKNDTIGQIINDIALGLPLATLEGAKSSAEGGVSQLLGLFSGK